MNTVQSALTELISAVLDNRPPNLATLNEEEAKELFELARAHQLIPLLHPAVKMLKNDELSKRWLGLWEKGSVMQVLNQKKRISSLPRILNAFHEAGVPCIYLKGLTVASLYPCPDLRTMADIDLLFHPSDLERAVAVLTDLGYALEIEHSNEKHLRCTKADELPIELHQSLLSNVQGREEIDRLVWSQAIPFEYNGIRTLTLADETAAVYLFLHITQHMYGVGFGLRQVIDLVIFLRNKNVDLVRLSDRLRPFGAETFFHAVLGCCRSLFAYEPTSLNSEIDRIPAETLESLTQFILKGGISGRFGEGNQAASLYLEYVGENKPATFIQRFHAFRRLAFPTLSEFRSKFTYHYLIARPWLLPYAWLHRWTRLITRKDYTFKDKMFFMSFDPEGSDSKIQLMKDLRLI